MRLTDELVLRDDGNILSNKYKLLKIGKFLGVKANILDEITNNGWNVADMEMEREKLIRAKQIFKKISDKIAYLICSENPTFHEQNDVQGTKVFQ